MVENVEYAAFLKRGIRAMGRRAANDVDALVLLRDLEREVDVALRGAVESLHENWTPGLSFHGYSYGEIAQRLGVTRQAVAKRFGASGVQEGAERGAEPRDERDPG